MKVLYVLRSVGHFPYHQSVISRLCQEGHRVQVLFERGWERGSCSPAVQAGLSTMDGLAVGSFMRRKGLWRHPLFFSREMLSYGSYLGRSTQSDYYRRRWESYLPAPVRLVVQSQWARRFVGSVWFEVWLRAFESLVPADSRIVRWLKDCRPDVVVVSPMNMRKPEEVEYVKAAKALGIPTIVPVLSWDNLTTKGLFHVIPDLTLVWNSVQCNEAVEIHRIPAETIVITGAPFFDKWFEGGQLLMEREAFCQKVGLDPVNPFCVYLGSSSNIASDETWLVREIVSCLREHRNPAIRKMNILVRPHPANARIFERLHGEQIIIWPKEGSLPDSRESTQDFLNTLRHSVATVGINTSAMIDAVIVDKPCVSIMTERYRSTQLQAVHFQYLLNADVFEVARSAGECADTIEKMCCGMDSKREQRRRFMLNFIRPLGLDMPAGHIAAQAISLAALGKSAAQIVSDVSLPNSRQGRILKEELFFSPGDGD